MINQDFILLIMNCKKYMKKALFQKGTWLKTLPTWLKYYHVIGDETLDCDYKFDDVEIDDYEDDQLEKHVSDNGKDKEKISNNKSKSYMKTKSSQNLLNNQSALNLMNEHNKILKHCMSVICYIGGLCPADHGPR